MKTINKIYEYISFDTKIGRCFIAWSDLGIKRIELPKSVELSKNKEFQYIKKNEKNIPVTIKELIDKIQEHIKEGRSDFSKVILDMSDISKYFQKVYNNLRKIKPGKTVSYKELALLCKSPDSARAVGSAMSKNPFLFVVPCHRVLSSDGKPGGFSAGDGINTKKYLLAIEGKKIK